MRKLNKMISVIIILTLLLSGCSTQNKKNEAANDTAGGNERQSNAQSNGISLESEGYPAINKEISDLGETVVEVWLDADLAKPGFVSTVKKFEQSYPNIEVQITGVPWHDIMNKVRLAVSGNVAPDVVNQHAFVAGAQGMAEPLDDLWETWGAEGKFLPGAIDDVMWNDTVYGVPLDINTIMLIYNKEMYEEAGITAPPKTMDELIEVSKKLTKDDGSRYGFVCTASSWNTFGLMKANGADLLKDSKPTLNDPLIKETLEKYISLANQNYSPVPPPQPRQVDNPVAMFGTERAAQFITGPWDIVRLKNEFPDVYDKIGTASVPGTTGSSVSGGGSLFIPKGAKNKLAAFELMKWLTSKEPQMVIAKEKGEYPAVVEVLDDPFFDNPLYTPYIEVLKKASPYKLEAFPESNDAWRNVIRAAFDGGDIGQLLESAQQIAENEIK